MQHPWRPLSCPQIMSLRAMLLKRKSRDDPPFLYRTPFALAKKYGANGETAAWHQRLALGDQSHHHYPGKHFGNTTKERGTEWDTYTAGENTRQRNENTRKSTEHKIHRKQNWFRSWRSKLSWRPIAKKPCIHYGQGARGGGSRSILVRNVTLLSFFLQKGEYARSAIHGKPSPSPRKKNLPR